MKSGAAIATQIVSCRLPYSFNISDIRINCMGVVRVERSKHLGIRVEQSLHEKLRYISDYEGRSMNGQILYLIQTCIREFERENGPIPAGESK